MVILKKVEFKIKYTFISLQLQNNFLIFYVSDAFLSEKLIKF